jgi:hypothetical protein
MAENPSEDPLEITITHNFRFSQLKQGDSRNEIATGLANRLLREAKIGVRWSWRSAGQRRLATSVHSKDLEWLVNNWLVRRRGAEGHAVYCGGASYANIDHIVFRPGAGPLLVQTTNAATRSTLLDKVRKLLECEVPGDDEELWLVAPAAGLAEIGVEFGPSEPDEAASTRATEKSLEALAKALNLEAADERLRALRFQPVEAILEWAQTNGGRAQQKLFDAVLGEDLQADQVFVEGAGWRREERNG